jgi:hypothetical protein
MHVHIGGSRIENQDNVDPIRRLDNLKKARNVIKSKSMDIIKRCHADIMIS